jgi:hypothetical protein
MGVVEVNEGLVYEVRKRLAIGVEFLTGGQAKGRVKLVLGTVAADPAPPRSGPFI